MDGLDQINEEAERVLLQAARNAIAVGLGEPARPSPQEALPPLSAHWASFVTLRDREGQLRGCMGSLNAHGPLAESVRESAFKAANRDPRYPPVQAHELDGIRISVSVLSSLVPTPRPSRLVVGRDGVVVHVGDHTATYLPEVATRFGWDAEQLLTEVCLKAGLPESAWRSPNAIHLFRTRNFAEPAFADGDGPKGDY